MNKITDDLRFKAGIYVLQNKLNNKQYIGSSKNLYNRLHEHWHNLKYNKSHNKHLQAAWNKYGEENFQYDILEFCDVDVRFDREQYYLDLYQPAYNFATKVLANVDRKLTDEEKHKISETLKRKYKNGELKAYDQRKLWKTTYVYDIHTFRIVYTAENKIKALQWCGINHGCWLNHRAIYGKYFISYHKLKYKDAKELIIKSTYSNGHFIIVEKNHKYYYFRKIADLCKFCDMHISYYQHKMSPVECRTIDNPFIYNNLKIFISKEFIGLQPS